MKARPKYHFFLSHSSRDQQWTRRFAGSLKNQGFTVWVAEDHVKPGDDIAKALAKGIRESESFVTIVDPFAITSPNIFIETGAAIGMGKHVTFVVPKGKSVKETLPVKLSQANVFLREAPSKTARTIAERKRSKAMPRKGAA